MLVPIEWLRDYIDLDVTCLLYTSFRLHAPAGICIRVLNREESILKLVFKLWKGDEHNWKEQKRRLRKTEKK